MSEEDFGAGMITSNTSSNGTQGDLSNTTNTTGPTESSHPPTMEAPTIPIQKKQVEDIYESSLERGKTYYVLCSKWFRQWKRYVGFQDEDQGSESPDMIVNEHLFLDTGTMTLRKGISEGSNFEFIQEEVWNLLKSWYGYDYEIKRIASSDAKGNIRIQLNPVSLRVVKSSDESDVHPVKIFTMLCTVKDFIRLMTNKMNLKAEDVRLWDYYEKRKIDLLNDKRYLSECNLMENQLLLLEERGENGEFPPVKTSYDRYSSRPPSDPGKTGLDNLGNTCFMNSAIQCLSSIVPLTDFFVSDEYKKDVNEKNPLGMKGQVANAFGSLLKELWSPSTSVVAPRDFKRTIEKFATQFSGYQQHDSQELVAFLLDGLHEDLNRVINKPYVEEDETERSDAEMAEISWNNYLKRNNSIIVDNFQGLLKSRLVCPTCSKVSIKFDPFMYLTLPLPMETKRKLFVTLHFLDYERKPTRFCVKVEKDGSIKDLINVLSEASGLKPEDIKIYEVFKHKFYKRWKDNHSISDISDNDKLFAFEIEAGDEYTRIKVENGRKDKHRPDQISLYGEPFLLNIKKNSTPREVFNLFFNKIKFMLGDEVIPEYKQEEIVKEQKNKADDSDDDDSDSDEDLPSYVSTSIASLYVVNQRVRNTFDLFKKPIDTPLEIDRSSKYYLTFGDDEYSKYIEDDENKWFTDDESVGIISKELENRRKFIDLEESLKMFTEEEVLSVDDTWYCNRCKEHKQATKKFDLWKLPKILVIHLKRFSYKSKFSKDKIDIHVNFPLKDLDLSKFTLGENGHENLYDLIAVSNHMGGMGGGHYTAYAYHRNDNKWYDYNDSSVREVSEKEICTSSAYLLFYKRKDVPWSAFEFQIPEPEPEPETIDQALMFEA